ncbi:hypothetical protein DFJ74DRAFT_508849 [Hyaloraphidium curvatum]|nr:hypothetical protein DFJ74DRAFT_508849 [Hyaloraphidium curvatum]
MHRSWRKTSPADVDTVPTGRPRLLPELMKLVATCAFRAKTWNLPQLLSFMLTCRDTYFLLLPLFLEEIYLGDDVAPPRIRECRAAAFRADFLGSDKFQHVRKLSFYHDQGCPESLQVLALCMPSAREVELFGSWDRLDAVRIWGALQMARNLQKLEVGPNYRLYRPPTTGYLLPTHLRRLAFAKGEVAFTVIAQFMADLELQAHMVDEFYLVGGIDPKLGIGPTLLGKMRAGSVDLDRNLSWLLSSPDIALEQLEIFCGFNSTTAFAALSSSPPSESVVDLVLNRGSAGVLGAVLPLFPAARRIAVKNPRPWPGVSAEYLEKISTKLRGTAESLAIATPGLTHEDWKGPEWEKSWWISLCSGKSILSERVSKDGESGNSGDCVEDMVLSSEPDNWWDLLGCYC